MDLAWKSIEKNLYNYFAEDDLVRNVYYTRSLPTDPVSCQLQFKSDLVIAGLPYFSGVFRFLHSQLKIPTIMEEYEGKEVKASDCLSISFELPFNLALTGERLALNLLQRASSIATLTRKFVQKAEKHQVAVLDTRKTTPGLRALEKYAVRVGGGHNHRFGQADAWMIKDNHKNFFGGIEEALRFFKSMQTYYNPIIVEIHNLDEFRQAIDLKVSHVMLDNFTPNQIRQAVVLKPTSMTIEVSGGLTLDSVDDYIIEGVDAISVGTLTYNAPFVDISLKYYR